MPDSLNYKSCDIGLSKTPTAPDKEPYRDWASLIAALERLIWGLNDCSYLEVHG